MLNNRKGVAMLIVIGLVLMLLILGGAALMISTGHFGTSYHQIKRARAYYAAEAAMQHALWKCRIGLPNGYDLGAIPAGSPGFIQDSMTVTDPNYSINVDIKVYEQGSRPLGPGVPTPAGTYPIVVSVQ